MRRFIVVSSANWNTVSVVAQTEVSASVQASVTAQTEERTGTLFEFFLALVEAPLNASTQPMLLPDTHSGVKLAGGGTEQSPNGLNPAVFLLTTPSGTLKGGGYGPAGGFTSEEAVDYAIGVDLVNSIKFTVQSPGATLVSITDAQWRQGVNAIVVGNEVIYFQNVTLLYGTTYKLTNLMRGMVGTAPTQHAVGEIIVLLNQYENVMTPRSGGNPLVGLQPAESVPISPSFLNRTLFLKATSIDQLGNEQPISSVSSLSRTYLGTGGFPMPISTLTPVSNITNPPTYGENDVLVSVAATPNRNLQVTWVYQSVMIGEDSELESGIVPSHDQWFSHYRIAVYVAGVQVRLVDNQTTEGYTYTEAMNVADNGSWKNTVRLDISVIDINGGQSPIVSRTYKMF